MQANCGRRHKEHSCRSCRERGDCSLATRSVGPCRRTAEAQLHRRGWPAPSRLPSVSSVLQQRWMGSRTSLLWRGLLQARNVIVAGAKIPQPVWHIRLCPDGLLEAWDMGEIVLWKRSERKSRCAGKASHSPCPVVASLGQKILHQSPSCGGGVSVLPGFGLSTLGFSLSVLMSAALLLLNETCDQGRQWARQIRSRRS